MTLAYSRTGNGAPLVLLHGLGHRRQGCDDLAPTSSWNDRGFGPGGELGLTLSVEPQEHAPAGQQAAGGAAEPVAASGGRQGYGRPNFCLYSS